MAEASTFSIRARGLLGHEANDLQRRLGGQSLDLARDLPHLEGGNLGVSVLSFHFHIKSVLFFCLCLSQKSVLLRFSKFQIHHPSLLRREDRRAVPDPQHRPRRQVLDLRRADQIPAPARPSPSPPSRCPERCRRACPPSLPGSCPCSGSPRSAPASCRPRAHRPARVASGIAAPPWPSM